MEKVYCKNKSCKYCRLSDMSCAYRHSLVLNEKGECETFKYWLAKELAPNQTMRLDGEGRGIKTIGDILREAINIDK